MNEVYLPFEESSYTEENMRSNRVMIPHPEQNRVLVTFETDEPHEMVQFATTKSRLERFVYYAQKKENYFIKALKNLKIQNNFYELALQLEEGQISEEEYDNKIENHPDNYVVSPEHLEDSNDIDIIKDILKKIGLEFSLEEASEMFSIEQEELENGIIENK